VSLQRGVTVLARRAVSAARPMTAHTPGGGPARTPAALQTTTKDADRRRRQTTDADKTTACKTILAH